MLQYRDSPLATGAMHTSPKGNTPQLSAVRRMNYNPNRPPNSNCPYTLKYQVRDGGGAQEEPYVCVRSAHVRSGNPRTGCGLAGLATPAIVNKTPNHVSHKADNAKSPGRGLCGSDTDPFRSLTLGGEEAPEDNSTDSMSDEGTSTLLTEEENPPEPRNRPPHRRKANDPKKKLALKIASLNMRGRQKDGKDKMTMIVDWMRVN